MRSKLIAGLVLLLAAAAAHTGNTAYFDVSLDEEGQVTAAVPASEIHPALLQPLRDWVTNLTFEAATVDGKAVPSTTSVRLSYALDEVDDGYELQVLEHFNGPRPVRKEEPAYPRNALLTGQEGWVKLGLKLEPSGKVSDVKVLDSSSWAFEKVAVRAARNWRFQPNTVDGKPIPAELVQVIEFKLD